ncbi:MAG: Flp pilus assembly protein CpaB [Massilia sp.]
MKNKRAIMMMTLAIVLGLGAVVLAWRFILPQRAANAYPVVVATAEVALGQRLTKDMLKVIEWPNSMRPEGAFADPAKLVDRVLKSSITPGDLVSASKLAPEGTSGGLSAVIKDGKRAITVRVNDVIGVAGFALPGNFVDIIVSTQKDNPSGDRNNETSVSKIVLERILVLAVAQELGRDDTKPKVVNAVTLEVSPDQAERLDLARSVGTLSLALRNQVDLKDVQSDGATKRKLLQEVDPLPKLVAVAAKPAPRPISRPVVLVKRTCVGVLNGVNVSQECF